MACRESRPRSVNSQLALTQMKRALLFLSLAASLYAQDFDDLNEGVTLSAAPEYGAESFLFSWFGKGGRTYFIETTDDLAAEPWSSFPERISGSEQIAQLGVAIDVPRRFYRLRYVEALSYIGSSYCDLDHDGLGDEEEVLYGSPVTNPFRNLDSDNNDLPDDWEQRRLGSLGNDPDPVFPVTAARRTTRLGVLIGYTAATLPTARRFSPSPVPIPITISYI